MPLLVLDESGLVLAGPPELRRLLSAEVIARLLARPTERIELDGYTVSARRVDDPEHPWLVVRAEVKLRPAPLSTPALTCRQLEVARLAALGRRCHEIGRALGCSTNTVRSHLRIIYDRLAVSNRIELMRALGEP